MSDAGEDWNEEGSHGEPSHEDPEAVRSENSDLDDGGEADDRPESKAELLRRELEEQDDIEPVAEGEEDALSGGRLNQWEEPSYAKCNAIPFATLVARLEGLRQGQQSHHSWKDSDRIQRLLPARLVEYLRAPLQEGGKPESIFPLYRLLMPDKDSSRLVFLKESLLADMYIGAFDLLPRQQAMLRNYTNPMYVKSAACGDFSAVLEESLAQRCPMTPSNLTLKDINAFLDELLGLKQQQKTGHDYRYQAAGPVRKKAKGPTLKERRTEWLRKQLRLNNSLSPCEHKWFVRIILRKLDFGIGFTRLLNWYDPRAIDLWNARSTLKRLCDELAFSKTIEQEQTEAESLLHGPLPYLTASNDIEFGVEFDPMRSEKTGFQIVLSNLSGRHREHFASASSSSSADPPLAAVHPAFTVETKLDGERMIVHFRRDGVVRIHSRAHVWYSQRYAPVLGPALRRALGEHQMDVILDGEVNAWDSIREETVPFGNNRTIAIMRQMWMERNGLCDNRDSALHKEEEEGVKAMRVGEGKSAAGRRRDHEFDLAGELCWLQFVAFDLLYLNGPGAEKLIQDTVSSSISPRPVPGSMISLDCMERKKLLHRVIKEQPHEVEIVETHVIRPNGKVETGRAYFNVKDPLRECGYPLYTLDSIACCLSGEVRDLARVDTERRRRQSDEAISQARAFAVNQIYKHYVEESREEGLIFKDLSTLYVLGERHRSKRYWLKFKPDYFNGAVASDLDVIIVGAYFASGLRSAGLPSSFLCACVDSQDPRAFFPLTKVNARSVKDEDFKRILKHTGYANNTVTGGVEFGHWYPDHRVETLPTFVSHRSYQQLKSKAGGWKYAKADIPDLWIDPERSVVVTLNAGEIVSSEVLPAGLTLRFPRITRLRMGGDAKSPYDIESDESLWQLYEGVLGQRASARSLNLVSITDQSAVSLGCRFLTESELLRQKRQTKIKRAPQFVPLVPNQRAETNILAGREFTVLNGRYSLRNDENDEALAKREGWYEDASTVSTAECVQIFIKKHSGSVRLLPQETTYLLGGMPDDVRVKAYSERSAGVLRWSYVFRLVSRLKVALASGLNVSEGLEPAVLDYLVRPLFQQHKRVSPYICRQPALTEVEMMRALEIIGLDRQSRSKPEKKRLDPDRGLFGTAFAGWQEIASCMPPRLQAIVYSPRENLWPLGMENKKVVLYADIFRNDFGLTDLYSASDKESMEERWDSADSSRESNEIGNCVTLASAMGAFVTSHLHSCVTHVLSHLQGDLDRMLWKPGHLEEDDSGLRPELVDRMNAVCPSGQIVLLTPAYLNGKFPSLG